MTNYPVAAIAASLSPEDRDKFASVSRRFAYADLIRHPMRTVRRRPGNR